MRDDQHGLAVQRLTAITALRRVCMVVERVKEQVPCKKPDGTPSSKWVDTQEFTVSLFPGGHIEVEPLTLAQRLVAELNTLVAEVLAPDREKLISEIMTLSEEHITLEDSKRISTLLENLKIMDQSRFRALSQGDSKPAVISAGIDGFFKITGTDSHMINVRQRFDKGAARILDSITGQAEEAFREAMLKLQ